MLACCRFYGSHTGEAIVDAFEEVVHSFDISRKVDTVVTDNASNMKKAFRLLTMSDIDSEDDGEEIEDEELVPVGLDLECGMIPSRYSCLSHTIQLGWVESRGSSEESTVQSFQTCQSCTSLYSSE